MKKYRLVYLSVMLMVCYLGIVGCGEIPAQLNEIENIGDLKGREVYFMEGNNFTPYLVLTNDYNGNTLLLRKHLLTEDLQMNDYYAVYENCKVDKYLNEVFIENFDEKIQSVICNSDVEVVAENYFYEGVTIKEINRKIFLLSYKELGLKDNYCVGDEGKALEYFKIADNRISSKSNSNPSSWWLRSVDTTYESCFYAVGAKGEIGSTNAYDNNGIRPAFCIPSNTPVVEKTGIIQDETVYVIH